MLSFHGKKVVSNTSMIAGLAKLTASIDEFVGECNSSSGGKLEEVCVGRGQTIL